MNTIPHPEELRLLSVNYVQRQFTIMDEQLIALRNAAKARRIEGTAREHWRLAEEMDNHAKRVSVLADELRRNAK